jgi:hypothetical protein
MIETSHQILVEWSIQGECDGRVTGTEIQIFIGKPEETTWKT